MAEYQGVDALLAAITDETLPEGAQDDAEFMAEHGSALADVALLREQLTLIGDALADGAKRATAVKPVKPVRARAPRKRRPLKIAFGALAVACAAGVMAGMGWLVVQAGQGVSDDAGASSADKAAGADEDAKGDSSLSAPGYLACSRLVVEGTVAQVDPVPGGALDRITLDVSRYYKPDRGKDQITFVMAEDVDPRLHKGDHVLVGIPLNSGTPDIWTTDEKQIAQERAWILDALPDSREITC
ncbi:hypothetical protein [Streptomyces sp. NBC_00038]|uniref:hypothetical protein n=1 Tax=Streptomyces sp. NBC_00038 TaxID=2903615 RepID=UPI002259ADB1|nr:hypothetical protein [Streptomyces sp. NBC_00038]MCX5557731.1 hypothetical protein [Streptomyces sp. NBC_00038]